MDVPISCLLIGLCLFGSFFFSASETALSCCNRFKFQIKADDGNKTSKIVLRLCEKFDQSLSVILIGNNIVAIVSSAISTLLFLNVFNNLGILVENEIVSIVSTVFISLIFYIFGDTFPKTIARLIPDTISYIVAWPIYILLIIIYPITLLFKVMMTTIEKAVNVDNTDDQFTEEDFETIVEKSEDDGILDEEHSEIIQSALDFADTKVKEVLTPRDKIFALDINELDREKLHSILSNSSYSRIPIYKGNIDNIIGVLCSKVYFKAYMKNPEIKIRKTLQKPYFVSPNVMIDDLFNGFKKNKTHFAIVRDSSFKILGIITMDDVLEELVSDIGETDIAGLK